MQWTQLALSIGMAVAAGLVGCFAVMRRMALASDAMSHVALPGIGLALLLHLHPLLGGLTALLVGTLLVWSLERRARIATETVIGVVFSLALAVGSMLATGEELVDALLGAPGTLGGWELALGLAGAALVVAFVLTQRNRLVIALVSRDIARTSGIRVARLELLYLLAFALTVALGLRFLGVLLMGSLVIIPAATAKHLARSLDGMFAIAGGTAVVSTLAGELLASRIHRATGPVIIAIAAGMFLATLLIRSRVSRGD
jgi:ABC-type Mn2+/Zn2+ transport system permease subunit